MGETELASLYFSFPVIKSQIPEKNSLIPIPNYKIISRRDLEIMYFTYQCNFW